MRSMVGEGVEEEQQIPPSSAPARQHWSHAINPSQVRA